MDKTTLQRHKALTKEIHTLQNQLDKLYSRSMDIPVIAGKVKGSSKNFPYTEVRTTVLMDEPVQADQINKLILMKKELIEKDQLAVLEIEQYVSGIDDPEVRHIFELTFYEGMTQREVADIVGLEQSSVSKKIKSYLKLSYNS